MMNWFTAVQRDKQNNPRQRILRAAWRPVPIRRRDWFIAVSLFVVWLLTLLFVPAYLPIQVASWMTLVALLITPGYFLADLIMWRRRLDFLEHLALAMPMGIAVLALPGMAALLLHQTLSQFAISWIVVSEIVMVVWLLGILRLPLFRRLFAGRTAPATKPWAVDELLLAALLVGLFLMSLPVLSQYKIDGDAFAVSTFTAEALAELPLNVREPLFGTEFGPGVRMVFNQYMTLSYLWSYFAVIEPLTITAVASRNILAVWVLLAFYMLGKSAGNGSRRLGLFTAVIQLLIYMAGPFLHADNVSLFFFERLNADKFLVMITLVPIVLALAMRYVRHGRRDVWLAAALASFAASTIHPLSAAMLALALTAFGGLHALINWRKRTAWWRTAGMALLVVAVMALPLIQLGLSRGADPLAASYPDSFEGWPLEERRIPVLPFGEMRGLDLYGTVPELAQLDAAQANETTNPFLIWRFDVNMDRQRLVIFDLDTYMSNPRLLLEPPYLLALFLLLFLLHKLRTSIAVQLVTSVTAAVLLVMFVPVITPLIGSFVMPWILWRFIWLLPYALIIALAFAYSLSRFGRLLPQPSWLPSADRPLLGFPGIVLPGRRGMARGAYVLAAVAGLTAVLLTPDMRAHMQSVASRPVSPYFYPTPTRILATLNERTDVDTPAMVLADQDISVAVAAYVANAHILAHRVPTTSEIFPEDKQEEALQRLIDQDTFFGFSYLTAEALTILDRYDVDYLVVAGGSGLDVQLRLAQPWFTWLQDDQSYSLYRVNGLPAAETAVFRANSALAAGDIETAGALFTNALAANEQDSLAIVGMADVALAQGQFAGAAAWLEQAAAFSDSSGVPYRLGQVYIERGLPAQGVAALTSAVRQSPRVSRYYAALGDACLLAGDESCAEAAYTAVPQHQSLPDRAARLMVEAGLWQQQGYFDRAIPLFEQAVAQQPTLINQFVLEGAYREAGQVEEAAALMTRLQATHQYEPDVALAAAAMFADLGNPDAAVSQYRRAIRLQRLQILDTTNTRLLLIQLLLDNGRLDAAAQEVDRLLAISPNNASAHKLHGDLLRAQGQFDEATGAYQRAFLYDPTRVELYVSLSNLLRQHGGRPDEVLSLLETAVTLNPDEPSLYLALGDQLQRAGRIEDAVAVYQSALEQLEQNETAAPQRPGSPRQSRAFALLRLGQIYESWGEIDTAMDYFQAMAAAAPEIPWTQVLLGNAWRQRGDAEKASALYEQALTIDPLYINAYVNLAELYYAQGQIEEASLLYHEGLNLAVAQLARFNADLVPASRLLIPGGSAPQFSDEVAESSNLPAPGTDTTIDLVVQLSRVDENLAIVRAIVGLYQQFGQLEEGIALYQTWLSQGEQEGWSAAVMAQLFKGLGDLHLARVDYAAALAAYDEAVLRDQWWVEAYVGRAQAEIGTGEIEAGVESLETAVSIAPGSVEAEISLADALMQLNRVEEALTIYETSAELFPGNARATMSLARAYQTTAQWSAAATAFEQTIATNPAAIDAYIGRAEIAMIQNDLALATQLLQQASDVDANHVNVKISFGNLAQRQLQMDEALDWYQQAAALLLAEREVNLGLIDALLRHGDLETALALVEQGLALQPQEQGLHWRLAVVQTVTGRLQAAEETLVSALEAAPQNLDAVANLSTFYQLQGRAFEARSTHEDALAWQSSADTHLALSRLWLNQGDVEQAEAILRDGMELLPDNPDLVVALSDLLIQLNDPEAARIALEDGVVAMGEEVSLMLALSEYYAAIGDFEQAATLLAQVKVTHPLEADIPLAQANLAVRQAQWDEAWPWFEEAIALAPADPGGYLAWGNGLLDNGRVDDAISAFTKAIGIAPDFVSAYVGLGDAYRRQEAWDLAQSTYAQGIVAVPLAGELYAEYAGFLISQGEIDGAQAAMEEAVQRAPVPATFIALAPLYEQIGAPDEGEQLLYAALAQAPGSLDVLLALGDFHAAQGNSDLAREHYQQLLALAPGLPISYLRLSNLANDLGDRTQADLYAALVQELALAGGIP